MRIDLFRSGTHTAMGGQQIAFSDADLSAVASGYDATKHEAPIVVGHPSHDAPAYGWVSGLSFADGKLVADAAQVDPAFQEMVGAGRFKKVSASFYSPDSAANPTPGAYHLRHVGFLGAQPPAVKGLNPVEFASGDEGLVTVEFGDTEEPAAEAASTVEGGAGADTVEAGAADTVVAAAAADTIEAGAGDTLIAGGGADTLVAGGADSIAAGGADTITGGADSIVAAGGADTIEAGGAAPLEPAAAAAAFAEREQLLAGDRERFAAERAAFAEEQRAARRARTDVELGALVDAGRLAPGWRAPVASFMEQLGAVDAVSFSEGAGAETPHDFMLRLLKGGGVLINFSEAAPPSRAAPGAVNPSARAEKIRERVNAANAAGRSLSFAEAAAQIDSQEAAS